MGTCTQSTDFPTSNNAYQTNFGGGNLDGCLFKLDNKLQNLVWSTYIGGERFDAVYSIALNDSLDVMFLAVLTHCNFLQRLLQFNPIFHMEDVDDLCQK